MSHPIVLSFDRDQDATYPPWFDPSYFNEGIAPRFDPRRQISVIMQQSRHLLLFGVRHSYVFILFILCLAVSARAPSRKQLRNLLMLFGLLLVFCTLMYLSVKFLDRYIAGLFWAACISTFALLTINEKWKRDMISGAAVFMCLAIPAAGVQNVVRMRKSAIFSGKTHGWYSAEEFGTARKLGSDGIAPVAS